jgi:hypothetical protein
MTSTRANTVRSWPNPGGCNYDFDPSIFNNNSENTIVIDLVMVCAVKDNYNHHQDGGPAEQRWCRSPRQYDGAFNRHHKTNTRPPQLVASFIPAEGGRS